MMFSMLQIEDDAYQEDLGFSLGVMGKSKSGKVRGPPVDSKTKARISKSLQVCFINFVSLVDVRSVFKRKKQLCVYHWSACGFSNIIECNIITMLSSFCKRGELSSIKRNMFIRC